MTSFTQVFGGSPIKPSDFSYQAITLSANTAYNWPREASSANLLAAVNDVTATGAGYVLTLPDATLASTGDCVLFNNVGSNSFQVNDASGGGVTPIAATQSIILILSGNSTTAGTWRIVTLGATTAAANASALAGSGLAASAGKLVETMAPNTINTNYSAGPTDRATTIVWTGGAGTLTLQAPATVGLGWFIGLRNAGSGSLTVTPASGTIDGSVSLSFAVGDAAFLFTDGTNFFSLGRGQSATFSLTYISINVGGTGDYTLNASQQNQIIYKFTGTLTGNRNVIVPATVQQYWVDNETSGAYTLTVKTASGTGIAVTSAVRQILYCDGTNVLDANGSNVSIPIVPTSGGTGTTIAFTGGSIPFATSPSGVYAQDNSNLFWDNSNKRLGLGTAAPAYALDVVGSIRASLGMLITANGLTVSSGGFLVSAGGMAITGASTITGTLGGLTGLTVASGGASITGNSSVTGTLGVTSTLTASNALVVTTGGLTVSAGGAAITGNSTVTGTLNVTSTLTSAAHTASGLITANAGVTLGSSQALTFGDGTTLTTAGGITRAVAVASTTQTAIDFTGIPSTAKRVTCLFTGVSTNGSGIPMIQVGSGSVQSTGYSGGVYVNGSPGGFSIGFTMAPSSIAADDKYGAIVLVNISGNVWVAYGAVGDAAFSTGGALGGSVSLSGALDRVRFTTSNGTDTFDAGSVTILWE